MSGKFIMEPRVSFVSEFLKDIHDGKILVPRFQRELVWEWSQRRDLLCSIYEGLPIGALLIWNTRLQNIKSYDRIGPFPVSVPPASGSRTYLMDGLQRMSTLYGTTFFSDPNSSDKDIEEREEYSVLCDLESELVEDIFVLERDINPRDRLLQPYRFMPLNIVFNSKEILKFQRSIPLEKEHFLDRLEFIASAFRNYKIPVVPLETDDQALVTKSFERINSRGTTMSEAHMLNALSYSSDFDLLTFIDREREQSLGDLPNWKELDVDFVLLLLKTKLGFDPYERDTDALAEQLIKSPTVLAEVFAGIRRMALFSEEYLGIERPSQFPYRLQMLGLANQLLSEQSVRSEKIEQILQSWFWISTYTNSFGTTARNSQKSLEDLSRFVESGQLDWTLNHQPVCHSLKKYEVSFKSARIKAWAFAIALRLDEGNPSGANREVLNNAGGGAALVQLGKLRKMSKRPGACFLFNPREAKKATIEDWSYDLRNKHFVDDIALQMYLNDDLESFIEYREAKMFDWEKEKIILPAADVAKIKDIVKFAE
jgi:hypothetical protein